MQNQKTVHQPARKVIGIECRTSNNPEDAPRDIPRQWEKFYRENVLQKIPNKVSEEVIALYCDYDGDYTQPYSLVLGCFVTSLDQIPHGMGCKR